MYYAWENDWKNVQTNFEKPKKFFNNFFLRQYLQNFMNAPIRVPYLSFVDCGQISLR